MGPSTTERSGVIRRYKCWRRTEIKRLEKRREYPGNLRVVGRPRHSDAHPVENLLGGHFWRAQLLDQLADEKAAGARPIIDQFPGRGREDGQRVFRRIDRCEPGRNRSKPALVWISSCRVDDDEFYFRAFPVDIRNHVIEANSILPNVALSPELSVDGDKIGLSRNLNAVAAEVEQCRHAGANPACKSIHRALHIRLADILLEIDRKSGSMKLLGKGARILDRCGKRRAGVGIICVPNHQSHTSGLLLRPHRRGHNRRHSHQAEPQWQPHVQSRSFCHPD